MIFIIKKYFNFLKFSKYQFSKFIWVKWIINGLSHTQIATIKLSKSVKQVINGFDYK